MSSSDRAIQKLARELAGIKREVVSWRGPQADYTSLENSGNFTFKDSDGNVTAVVGGQDDGGTTVNVIAGPTPPTPVNYTVTVDHGSLTVHWDGEFEDDAVAPTDWARWTAYAQEGATVVPSRTTAIGGTDSASGGEVTAGVLKGQWTVTVLAWSQAGKPSAMGLPVTVDVPGYGEIVLAEIDAAETDIKNAGEILVTEQDTLNDKLDDAFGQIEDAIVSANGKNVVHYEDAPPTVSDPGVEGDTWFVGEFGRPTDVVQATNLVFNPSFEVAPTDLVLAAGLASAVQSTDATGIVAGSSCLSVTGAASGIGTNTAQITVYTSPGIVAGQYLGWGWSLRDASGSGLTVSTGVNWYTEGGAFISSEYQPYRPVSTSLGRLTSGFLVPATAYRARMIFRFRAADGASPAPANFKVLTDGWLSCAAKSQADALAAVGTYFDGDTPSGESDNDPHYRWTGEPHESTSEKYLPALDIGESDNWNVTEQYRHDGTGWKRVELSHEVISSADVGKLVAGSAAIKEAVVQKLWAEVVVAKMVVADEFIGENAILTGAITAPKITASEELWAKIGEFVKIRAEQIEADAIDGKVITGATYRTSGGGGSWSDDGLFIAQPDGTSMVRFPTDGSPLSLTASDVQIDRASITDLDLSYGAVRSGGQVTLASGVTAPVSPPELTTGWQRVASLPNPEERADVIGLASWGDKWVRGVNVPSTGEGDRVEIYNNDGSLDASLPVAIDPRQGVTVIGDIVYVVGKDHDRPQSEVYVFGYDLNTGARVSRARMDVVFDYRVAVGNDGTNVVTASVTKNGNLYVLRWNPVTGAQVGSDWSGVWQAGGRELLGVHVSGSEVTILPQQTARVYTVSGNTLTRKTDTANASGFAGWDNPNKNGAGMVWRGTFPCVVDRAGVVYQGSPFVSASVLEVCFVWTNGTYFTTPSPIATIDQGARQETTISLPVRAGLSKRVYTRTARAANWAKYDIAENVTSARVSGGVEIETLPATNTFPNADPATLKSTNDKFEVKGDGSGHWGNFNVDANGAMSGMIVTGFVLLAVDADNTTKKFTINLPAGRFTRPPSVWVNISTAAPQNVWAGVVSETISTATFEVNFRRTTTTTTGVTWFAMDSE